MKSSIFKSFRFEIVLYSLLSLFYTLLTEGGIFLVFYGVRTIVKNISSSSVAQNGVENTGRMIGGADNIAGIAKEGLQYEEILNKNSKK